MGTDTGSGAVTPSASEETSNLGIENQPFPKTWK